MYTRSNVNFADAIRPEAVLGDILDGSDDEIELPVLGVDEDDPNAPREVFQVVCPFCPSYLCLCSVSNCVCHFLGRACWCQEEEKDNPYTRIGIESSGRSNDQGV